MPVAAEAPAPKARATMRDATGRELGDLTISEDAGRVSVRGTLHSLPPGEHGIHLHMAARCEPPFASAGDHWNPLEKKHGLENPNGPHFGDLPNMTAEADSTATFNFTTTEGTLAALLDFDGASVIVHADRDDLRTDPSGNSGDRIACGTVIQ
ncbi:MAG: superoxide dismutase family protein [Gemmatimonadales bacterium]